MAAKGKANESWPRKATGLNAYEKRMAAGLPAKCRHSESGRLAAPPHFRFRLFAYEWVAAWNGRTSFPSASLR